MPKKSSDTSHLDQFSAQELEDILVQLCDSEGVKVSADSDQNVFKNAGTKVLDDMGLGGIGKALSGGGDSDNKPKTPTSDSTTPSKPPAPSRPAADVIRELPAESKQGLVGIIEGAIKMAMDSGILGGGDQKGGPSLLACFGNLLKGGGNRSTNANSTQAQNSGEAAASLTQIGESMTMDDIKTPDGLFQFITGNPAVKTFVISGVQSFLAKFLQGAAGGGQ